MKVRVYLLQEFISVVGDHMIEVEVSEGATVRELLERLPPELRDKVLGQDGSIRYPVEIMVNGRRIDFLQGLETRLRPGDRVHISPRALFVV